MEFRKATKEDIDKITDLRLQLLIEEAAFAPTDIKEQLFAYFNEELNKSIVVVLAEENGVAIATSAVIFQRYPPHFSNKQGMRAYITNVYTQKTHRNMGLSKTLLNMLLQEVKARGISYVWLWSTKEGVGFYKKFGFKDLSAFNTMDYHLD